MRNSVQSCLLLVLGLALSSVCRADGLICLKQPNTAKKLFGVSHTIDCSANTDPNQPSNIPGQPSFHSVLTFLELECSGKKNYHLVDYTAQPACIHAVNGSLRQIDGVCGQCAAVNAASKPAHPQPAKPPKAPHSPVVKCGTKVCIPGYTHCDAHNKCVK